MSTCAWRWGCARESVGQQGYCAVHRERSAVLKRRKQRDRMREIRAQRAGHAVEEIPDTGADSKRQVMRWLLGKGLPWF